MDDFKQELLGMGIVYGILLGAFFFPVAALIVGTLVFLTFGYNYLIERFERRNIPQVALRNTAEFPECVKTPHYAACL